MPTYEYACAKCSHQFEKFQPIADEPLKVCPRELCPKKTWGKGKIKRVIGAGAGLIFKGSGFYITDYRSENYKASAKKDTAPSTSGGEAKTGASTPATSTPAKTETKSKPKAKE